MPSIWPRLWRRKSSEVTLDKLTRDFLIGQMAGGLPVVTPDNAMQSPTVFAIVHGLSRVLGMLPIDVVDTADGVRQPVEDHPLLWLLNTEPNGWQTRQEYWSQIGASVLLHGEAVVRKAQAPNGRIVYLLPLRPGEWYCRQLDSFALEYIVNRQGMTGTYRQAQMHHIRAMTLDGLSGVSPVERCKQAIALEIAAERMALQVFGNAAIPNIVITHPAHFRDEDAFTRFKTSWREAFGAGKRGTAVLEDGIKAEALQLSNEESQFLESRKLQRSIIAAAWGVPPHRVGDLERATFSNVTHQSLEFVIYCLMPYLTAIEGALERDLLTANERGRLQIRFNVNALLRGDLKSRSEALKIQREAGVLSPNEWRRIEDMPPRDDMGGDEYQMPMNTPGKGASDEEKPKDTSIDADARAQDDQL